MLENGLTAHACRHTATNARQERVTSVRVRFFSVGHEAKRRASFIRLRSFYVFPFFFFHDPLRRIESKFTFNLIRSRRFLFFFPSTRFNLHPFLSLLPVFTFRLFSLVGKREKRKRGSLKSFCIVFFCSIGAQEKRSEKSVREDFRIT